MKNLALIILLIIPVICLAYDFDEGGVRNAALGGTGISSTNDVSAAVWNPALLNFIMQYQLTTDIRSGMIQLDNDNIAQNFLYFGLPVRNIYGTFALGLGMFDSQGYDEGKFGLYYGGKIFPYKLAGKLAAGIGVNNHYINYSEIGESNNAFDLDLGFSYKPIKDLQLGLSLKNIMASNIAIGAGAEDPLPRKFGLGVSYYWKRFNFISDVSFENYVDYNQLQLALGTEYLLARNFLLRVGVNNHNFTGGFGLHLFSSNFSTGFIDLSLDYAFQYPVFFSNENDLFPIGNDIETDLGDHFFGINIDFGKTRYSRDEGADFFPSKYGFEARVDSIIVEKVKIDTVYSTETVYLTEKILDEEALQQRLQKELERVRLTDMSDVNQATVHLIRALEYYYSQEYAKAIDECEEAILIAPNLSLSYLRLASIYYRLGDMEETMYHLKRGKRLDPENPEILKMMEVVASEND